MEMKHIVFPYMFCNFFQNMPVLTVITCQAMKIGFQIFRIEHDALKHFPCSIQFCMCVCVHLKCLIKYRKTISLCKTYFSYYNYGNFMSYLDPYFPDWHCQGKGEYFCLLGLRDGWQGIQFQERNGSKNRTKIGPKNHWL